MPNQVTSNVYQLKIPLPSGPGIPDSKLGYTFCYLIGGEAGWLLLDTGWNDESCFKALLEQLNAAGIGLGDIRWIVATHFHGDHFGLARRLSRLNRAKLLIHERDWRMLFLRLASDEDEKNFHDTLRKWLLAQGAPEEVADMRLFTPGGASLHPEDNMELLNERHHQLDIGSRRLEIMWTPGHTPGHICLYDKSIKVLFSGDFLLPTITPNIGLSPFDLGEPLGDYLASLNKIEKTPVELVLPGHEYTFTNFRERIEEIKEHHHERLGEALDTLRQMPMTAYDVATRLTWDVGPWVQTNLWEKRMATLETLAHLQHLVTQGKARKIQSDGSTVYGLALSLH